MEESPSRAGARPALLLPQAVRVTLSSARTARAAFLWVHDPPTRAARVPLPVYAAGRKLSLLARFGPHFLVARYQPSPVCAWHDVSPQFLTAPGLLTRAGQNPTCCALGRAGHPGDPARVRVQPFPGACATSPAPAIPARAARGPLETFLPERTTPPPSTRGASSTFLTMQLCARPCFLGRVA